MKKSYSNIIFDFGGVLLQIDYRLTEQAFVKLGMSNFQEIYSQMAQNDFFDRLETGNISEAEFYEGIRNFSKINLTDNDIRNAWNAMLIKLPTEITPILEKKSNTHRIFLLSNTNAIHEKEFSKILERDYGLEKFKSLFEKLYFSHHLHMRKPNHEIFKYVIDQNNLNPEQTVFIDDSIQHIHGAEKAGLQTIFLEKGKTIGDYF